jgi:hypothetical protein
MDPALPTPAFHDQRRHVGVRSVMRFDDARVTPSSLLDVEYVRRRCAAHDQWTTKHAEAVAFAEA